MPIKNEQFRTIKKKNMTICSGTPPCRSRSLSKKRNKQKQLGSQIYVPLLSFHAILR